MNIQKELEFFKEQKLWAGGYCEGDPLNKNSISTYGSIGFVNGISILHTIYLNCIKPYINQDTIALEIGPGRGAWTKCMLNAKKLYLLDAYSAEHNKFFDYVGKQNNVEYYEVSDFLCSMIPEDSLTYMFSFGCLCHVSYEGIVEYAKNLFPKFKSNSHCFWMVADYKKYNSVIDDKLDLNQNQEELIQGRWFNAYEKVIETLPKLGYTIIEADVDIIKRDPIIHFKKE